jgi:hypothetical protein
MRSCRAVSILHKKIAARHALRPTRPVSLLQVSITGREQHDDGPAWIGGHLCVP